jgi:hypothetical protein
VVMCDDVREPVAQTRQNSEEQREGARSRLACYPEGNSNKDNNNNTNNSANGRTRALISVSCCSRAYSSRFSSSSMCGSSSNNNNDNNNKKHDNCNKRTRALISVSCCSRAYSSRFSSSSSRGCSQCVVCPLQCC